MGRAGLPRESWEWQAFAEELRARFGWPLMLRQARKGALRVSVHPLRRVVLAHAHRLDLAALTRLIEHNARALQAAIAQAPPPRPFADGVRLPWGDAAVTLHHDPKAPPGGVFRGTRLFIGGPAAGFAARARRALKRAAGGLLIPLVEDCAARLQVTVRAVRLRETYSRWGSASAAGCVMLQWRLAFAPAAVQRYLAAHEVAHLVHPHHGRAFWAVVDSLGVDPQFARRWLRANGPALFAIGAAW